MPRAVTQQGAVIISVARKDDHNDAPIEVHVETSNPLKKLGHPAAMKNAFTMAAQYMRHLLEEDRIDPTPTASKVRLVDTKLANAVRFGIVVNSGGEWVQPEMYPSKIDPENKDHMLAIEVALPAVSAAMDMLAA